MSVKLIENTIPVLPVQDLERSIEFYRRTLGFEVDWQTSEVCSVGRDGCSIMLQRCIDGSRGTVWIGLEDDSLYAELAGAGVVVLQAPIKRPWAYEMKIAIRMATRSGWERTRPMIERLSRASPFPRRLTGVPSMALVACACAGQPTVPVHQPPKPWHISPSSDPRSSMLYPVVDWERVRRVRVGMCEPEAERVLGAPLQYYHHPVNAIVFTTEPRYGRMEVAFRLSADKCITDVSYKSSGGG